MKHLPLIPIVALCSSATAFSATTSSIAVGAESVHTATVATPTTEEPAPEPPAEVAPATMPGWPLEVGASFFTRFEAREGYDRLGVSRGRFTEGELAVYRARLRLDTAPIDVGYGQYVQLRFAPQVDGWWGNQPSTVSNPNIGVNEAFLRVGNDTFTFDAGHFMLDYGDALVIGNLGWHQTARTFDGARVRVQPGAVKYWIDAFVTQLSEGWGGSDPEALAGDAYFAGVYADLGPLLSDATTLEPYVLSQIWVRQDDQPIDPTDPTAGTGRRSGAVQGTIGVRAKQSFGMVDLRLETGLQVGKRRQGFDAVDALAYHFDVEVGVTPMTGLRLSLEGLYASGDDPDTEDAEGWDQLFPTAHKFLGLMDVIGGRTNIAAGVVHVAYKGIDSMVLKLDGHLFARPRTVDGQDTLAGFELDTNVIYIIGRGLTLRGMYSVFVPGSDHYFVDGESVTKPAHYIELQFGYAF